MFFRALVINLILVMLILLGTWYTWQQLTHSTNPLTTLHQPDAYATEVIVSHTDITGHLYDQLKTPLLVHYPLNDSTFLSEPLFSLFLKKNESWELAAKYGRLKENNELLLLWDQVNLTQKKQACVIPSARLTTSVLTIYLKKKTADTSLPVTIVQANQVIQAVGLHADFTKKTIQLLSQVTAQVKPTKK